MVERKLTGTARAQVEARVLDLSLGGALLHVATAFEVGTISDFAVPLDGGSMWVQAEVKRCTPAGGGYEIVHRSPGLEIGVYVLVAPEPDRQQPHEDDEVYVVLEGRGVLTIEDDTVEVSEGKAAFVPARADHRFAGYEGLSVLVVFARPHEIT